MHIHADTDLCAGSGQCALAAPDVFDQDDDGIVLVLEADPPESQRAAAERAAWLCPARAIRVTA